MKEWLVLKMRQNSFSERDIQRAFFGLMLLAIWAVAGLVALPVWWALNKVLLDLGSQRQLSFLLIWGCLILFRVSWWWLAGRKTS